MQNEQTITDLVEAIGEKAHQLKELKELKEKSQEVAEALAIMEEHQRLMKMLEEKCSTPTMPTIVPMPYPVYPPVYPTYPNVWYKYDVTCAASTGLTSGWNSGATVNGSSIVITAGARSQEKQ